MKYICKKQCFYNDVQYLPDELFKGDTPTKEHLENGFFVKATESPPPQNNHEEATSQIEELTANVKEATDRAKTAETKVADLEKQLKERDEEINHLTAENEALKNSNTNSDIKETATVIPNKPSNTKKRVPAKQ